MIRTHIDRSTPVSPVHSFKSPSPKIKAQAFHKMASNGTATATLSVATSSVSSVLVWIRTPPSVVEIESEEIID